MKIQSSITNPKPRFEVLEVADTSSVIDAFLLIVPSSSNTTESGSPSLPNAAGGTTAVGGASGGSGSGSDGKDGDRISRSLLLNSVSSLLSGRQWDGCPLGLPEQAMGF